MCTYAPRVSRRRGSVALTVLYVPMRSISITVRKALSERPEMGARLRVLARFHAAGEAFSRSRSRRMGLELGLGLGPVSGLGVEVGVVMRMELKKVRMD
jgi:hypothetical protein